MSQTVIPQKSLHKSSNRCVRQRNLRVIPTGSPTYIRSQVYYSAPAASNYARVAHGKTLPGEACWWTRVAWLARVILRRGRKHALVRARVRTYVHVYIRVHNVRAHTISNFFAILPETPLESLGNRGVA